MSAAPKEVVLWNDPYNDPSEASVEFRLTYEGLLLAASKTDTRAKHKQEIRRAFHPQLRRLWDVTPQLRTAPAVGPQGHVRPPFRTRLEWLAAQYQRCGYEFVPLVAEELSLLCSVSILFLRPDPPGSLIKSGDIDNRLKTLFDAFRIPNNQGELGGYDTPGSDERPFFCLLEDDRLITKLAVETDILLAPAHDPPDRNECRLVITVTTRPVIRTWMNGVFD